MDEAAAQRRKTAEDKVSLFVNGGTCSITIHPAATQLDKLIMLRQLRLDLRNQSSDIADIEAAIRRELRRTS